MTRCKRCGGTLTPGAASCSGCNRRVPNQVSVRPRQALARQRPRATVTRQPAVALATRPLASAPNQTLPPPAEWVAPAPEVIDIRELVVAAAAPPIAMPPPAANWAPPQLLRTMPPTVTRTRTRSSGSKAFRPVVWVVGILVVFSVIGAIDNAVQKSTSNDVTVTVPQIQFTPPTFGVPVNRPARSTTQAVHVNSLSDLITLVTANEIYRAQHGAYTNHLSALLASGQFRVNPQGDYQIGVGGGGYCMVGRDSNTVWRVYDANNPSSIAQTFGGEAAAKRACSLPVHWG